MQSSTRQNLRSRREGTYCIMLHIKMRKQKVIYNKMGKILLAKFYFGKEFVLFSQRLLLFFCLEVSWLQSFIRKEQCTCTLGKAMEFPRQSVREGVKSRGEEKEERCRILENSSPLLHASVHCRLPHTLIQFQQYSWHFLRELIKKPSFVPRCTLARQRE